MPLTHPNFPLKLSVGLVMSLQNILLTFAKTPSGILAHVWPLQDTKLQ